MMCVSLRPGKGVMEIIGHKKRLTLVIGEGDRERLTGHHWGRGREQGVVSCRRVPVSSERVTKTPFRRQQQSVQHQQHTG